MTSLKSIFAQYRAASQSENEKGTYLEESTRTDFRYEASYADPNSDVWLYADWARLQGITAKKTGINLEVKTQCNCHVRRSQDMR